MRVEALDHKDASSLHAARVSHVGDVDLYQRAVRSRPNDERSGCPDRGTQWIESAGSLEPLVSAQRTPVRYLYVRRKRQ